MVSPLPSYSTRAISGLPSNPPPFALFTSVPEVPVLLPMSTPPVTTWVPFRPVLSWQVVVLTANPRPAQVVPAVRILGLKNPDPGTANIFAARLLPRSLLIHWEVSTQLLLRYAPPVTFMRSKE